MMNNNGWYGGWGMGGMWLFWALPICAVILFGAWLVSAGRRR